MYPEHLTAPMKQELVEDGFADLKSASQVDSFLKDSKGTALVVVNSVCGCAAGTARPGVRLAVRNSSKKPEALATVFAGVDREATEKAREYLLLLLLSACSRTENWCTSWSATTSRAAPPK